MGAPTGNQFWKLRNTHGRAKLFASPELLLEACQEYFNWVDSKPWYKVEQLKKPYEEVYYDKGKEMVRTVTLTKIPTVRPYNIHGLCIYLDCNTLWFNQFESAINKKVAELGEDKVDEQTKDFSKILTHVRDVIYQHKFEGSVVGAFNASIIARDLSLVNKTDITSQGKEILSDKSDDDLKKLLQDTLRKIDG